MPWIVTIPTDAQVGPGVQVQARSNVNGPFETGTVATFVVVPPDSETAVYTRGFQITNDPSMNFQLYEPGDIQQPWRTTLPINAPCTVRMILTDPRGGVLDESDFDWHWNPTDAIGPLVQANGGKGQGLAPAERQQLLDVHQTVFPVANQDQMGVQFLTPPGGVPSLDVGLPGPVMGVIVRVDAIPDGLLPIKGDPNYWRQTLAQVSIFRSNDLWLRFPVHTQSRIFNLPGSETAAGVAAVLGLSWLLNMHLNVTTFPGVLVTVAIMTLP